MTGAPLLRVALQAGYSANPVLGDIQFELRRGEVLGLVGSSGAGKSTLVLALLGLLPWRGGRVHGEVLLEGKNLLEHAGTSDSASARPHRIAHSPKPDDGAQFRHQPEKAFLRSVEGAREKRAAELE